MKLAKSDQGVISSADLIVSGVPVYGATRLTSPADAIAIKDGRVHEVGRQDTINRYKGADTKIIQPQKGCVIPGLIDGHAHMDREGLKKILPSLDGAESKEAVLDAILLEVAKKKPGEWIVTMPIGTAPSYVETQEFDESGYPDRHDLDQIAPDNPVYIRAIWGYWRARAPLVSVANSKALELAGVGPKTPPPSDQVEIAKDAKTGLPTGVFLENTMMPIVELTLLSCVPNFTYDDRLQGLRRSMSIYNSFGTTSVFEGHGVASDVITGYHTLSQQGKASVRANLILSPRWSEVTETGLAEHLRDLADWLARQGYNSEFLNISGLYAEIDEEKANWVRASAAPQTGWAGFNYDCGLPRKALKEVLLEAARLKMRVSCIFATVAELFEEVHREVSIDGLRWSWGHLATLTDDEIKRARDLGLVMVTHTNRHIRKMGSNHRQRLGAEMENQIVPLRRLLDAGVPVSLATDNVPPTLFNPIYHAVARRDENTGEVVAPEQKLSREEALHCATWGGAYLAGQENHVGTLEPGKLADLVLLNDDLMSVPEDEIPNLHAEQTIVNGKIVFENNAS